MQPVRTDLTLLSGDTINLVFRLWEVVDGARRPLQLATGEQFVLTFAWGQSGRLISTTASGRTGRLVLVQDAQQTTLLRTLAAAETASMPLTGVTYTLVRIPAVGKRRTYLTGVANLVTMPLGSVGDTFLDVTIQGGGTTVEVTLADAASYSDLQIALLMQVLNQALAASAASLAMHKSDHGNPHAVTAGQVGAYTTAQVDTALAALRAGLLNGADAAHDTLAEIQALLLADEGTLAGLLTAVAARLISANNLSDLPNKATARGNLGLAIGSDVQAYDSDLTAIAALITTAFGRSRLTDPDAASARVNLGLDKFRSVGDASITILSTDRTIGLTAALTAPRVWTLPAASSVNPGASLRIVDVILGLTTANTLTIQVSGSDLINGATSHTFRSTGTDFQIVSDGVSRWTYDVQGQARGGTGATSLAAAAVIPAGGTATTVGAILVPLDPTAPGFQVAMAALWAVFEGALPSSDAGLPVGAWWSNGGIPTRVKVAS